MAHNRQGVIVLFKFQSDSINTRFRHSPFRNRTALNSNLILLIPSAKITFFVKSYPLNSNLILLIQMPPLPLSVRLSALNSNLILLIRYSVYAFRLQVIVFKFQSDSINTMIELTGQVIVYTLNSNLILLIQQEATKQ